MGVTSNMKKKTAGIFMFIMQIVFVVLMGVFAKYEGTAHAKGDRQTQEDTDQLPIVQFYAKFQDVNVMIFVGFGFLMTFLKRYSFSAFGFNMLLSAFVIEWATVLHGIGHMISDGKNYFEVHIKSMFYGEFAAAAILISFGALLGKVNCFQLVVMAFFEVVFQYINEYILGNYFQVVDVGGSMLVHAFGAYFGLAMSRVLYNESVERSKKEGSVYHSDLFAIIGSVFLWVYWPSFNGALAQGDDKHRAVINTFYAMSACTVVTFVVSMIVDTKGKLDMVHIQNATLAGGVAVGTSADLMIQPWGAMTIGSVAGLLSVCGYKYVTPFLTEKLKIHDTCGVNNLHGMPAILAGIAGVVASALATHDVYGDSLYSMFAARAPSDNTTAASFGADPGLDRTAGGQAGYQAAGLVVTLVFAIASGTITGFILKLPFFSAPDEEDLFDDAPAWEIPDDGYPTVEKMDEPMPEKNAADTRM